MKIPELTDYESDKKINFTILSKKLNLLLLTSLSRHIDKI